jgi:hypothetical protein
MALLKKKPEKNGTIAVRVPESAQKEYAALRQVADGSGFDLSGSLTDTVLNWMKQVRKELGVAGAQATEREVVARQSNGLLHERESNGVGRQRGSGGSQD